MGIFPFKGVVLKTELARNEVVATISDHTFLTDANYKPEKSSKKFFYGSISSESFQLESIGTQKQLVPHFSGTIKGVENEMYVFLSLRAFKHRRLYALLQIFLLASFVVLLKLIFIQGLSVKQPEVLMFVVTIAILLMYNVYTVYRFQSLIHNSIGFFRGMLQADVVTPNEVPLIFRD